MVGLSFTVLYINATGCCLWNRLPRKRSASLQWLNLLLHQDYIPSPTLWRRSGSSGAPCQLTAVDMMDQVDAKLRSASPFVFILALIIALFFSQFDNIRIPHFGMSGASSALPWAYTGSTDGARNPKPRFAFSSVTGFFLQDDPATDDNGFEYVCCLG